MKKFAKISIIFFITALTFSCYKPLELGEVKSVNLNFDDDDGQLEVFLEITNPNFYSITIVESNLDVYLNGTHLGKIKDSQNVKIPANSSTIVQLNMHINLQDVLSNVFNLITLFSEDSDTDVKIEGTITGKTFFGKKEIPINEEKTMEKS